MGLVTTRPHCGWVSRLGAVAGETRQTDRDALAALLGNPLRGVPARVDVHVCGSSQCDGFVEQLVEYESGGERVPAYVLLPDGSTTVSAAVDGLIYPQPTIARLPTD
jgi:hypothetical protein